MTGKVWGLGGRVPFFVVRLLEALTRVVTNPPYIPHGCPSTINAATVPLASAGRSCCTDGRDGGRDQQHNTRESAADTRRTCQK